MTDHPITPPPEVFVECWEEAERQLQSGASIRSTMSYAIRTAYNTGHTAGADQKLQACCDAIYKHEGEPLCGGTAEWLRNAMSPKPPSLKQQAISDLHSIAAELRTQDLECNFDTILLALEVLSDE